MWQSNKKSNKIEFGRPPTAKEEHQELKKSQKGKANLTNTELLQRIEALEKVVEELTNTK